MSDQFELSDLPHELILYHILTKLEILELVKFISLKKEYYSISSDLTYLKYWLNTNYPELNRLFIPYLKNNINLTPLETIYRIQQHVKYAELAGNNCLEYMSNERAFLLAGRQFDLKLFESLKIQCNFKDHFRSAFIQGLIEGSKFTRLPHEESIQLATQLLLEIKLDLDARDLCLLSYIKTYLRNHPNFDIEQPNKYLIKLLPEIVINSFSDPITNQSNVDINYIINHATRKAYPGEVKLTYDITRNKFSFIKEVEKFIIKNQNTLNYYGDNIDDHLKDVMVWAFNEINLSYIHHEELELNIFKDVMILNEIWLKSHKWFIEQNLAIINSDEFFNNNHEVSYQTLLSMQKYYPYCLTKYANDYLTEFITDFNDSNDLLAGKYLLDLCDLNIVTEKIKEQSFYESDFKANCKDLGITILGVQDRNFINDDTDGEE